MHSSLRPAPIRQPCQPSTSGKPFAPCSHHASHVCRGQQAMHASTRPVGPVVTDWDSLQAAYKAMVQKQQPSSGSKAATNGKAVSSAHAASKAVSKSKQANTRKGGAASSSPATHAAAPQADAAKKQRDSTDVQQAESNSTSSKQQSGKNSKKQEHKQQRIAAANGNTLAAQADHTEAASLDATSGTSGSSSTAPFRGFGSPPAAPAAAAAPVQSGKVLRLFRYSVEQSKIDQAIRDNGWQGRVVQVDSIQEADAIIAVKLTAGGKHQNLSQGERAAENAGLPFVVAGRQMTKDSLRRALGPMLTSKSR